MSDDAIQAAIVLFRASVGLRPAGASDAVRRVVLAQAMIDRLEVDSLLETADLGTDLNDRSPIEPVAQELTANARTAVMACLLADVASALARTTTAGGARRAGELLRSVPGLDDVASAIENRFERIDGTGHPSGLNGGTVPIGSRVVAVTDVLVGRSQRAPIDWERRIETMKDSAGAALDPAIAQLAYETLRDEAVRRSVERATVDVAIAAVSRYHAPNAGLAGVARLLHQVHDPAELAEGLLRQAWPTTHFGAVGLQYFGPGAAHVVLLGPDPDIDLRDAITGTSGSVVRSDGVVAVPVIAADADAGPWGAVWGQPRSGTTPTPVVLADIGSLELIAATLAMALARASREAELTVQAQRDQLTGLVNRRQLEAELAQVFDGSVEDRLDVALVMCDVDGLKSVNDTRGHAAGDDVLRAVARVLETALDGFDGFAARLGGDEFCLVLRTGGILHAQTVARRATAGVTTSVAGDVGLSCGIAYAARSETPGELLSGADLAQYQVKARRPTLDRRSDAVPGRRRRRDR